ncbi:uncharacterized protein LOC120419378 [Culex pipiens pallens]|uniref:uncharacterized protein LOC120419378 n=1 Tax=Culex pipiens pallens TaxID=42434 RepID=UPI0022AA8D0D|nr:uncharacterized protein LOC120419378 [Culex pipiens pallens]
MWSQDRLRCAAQDPHYGHVPLSAYSASFPQLQVPTKINANTLVVLIYLGAYKNHVKAAVKKLYGVKVYKAQVLWPDGKKKATETKDLNKTTPARPPSTPLSKEQQSIYNPGLCVNR